MTQLNKPAHLPKLLHFTSLPQEAWGEEDTHSSEPRGKCWTRWHPRSGDKAMCRPAWQGSSRGSSTFLSYATILTCLKITTIIPIPKKSNTVHSIQWLQTHHSCIWNHYVSRAICRLASQTLLSSLLWLPPDCVQGKLFHFGRLTCPHTSLGAKPPGEQGEICKDGLCGLRLSIQHDHPRHRQQTA